MKKMLRYILIIGLSVGPIVDLYAHGGGSGGGHFGGGGGHMGGGHMGGARSGSFRGGGHSGSRGGTRAARSGRAHGAHAGHGGHGNNHQHNRNWNHAHGYGWGWGNGGWGRGWGWGFWGWPFWWGLWYPWPFLYVSLAGESVAAWSVANQTPDTIIITSDDDTYEIDAGDSQLIPKSEDGNMHIKARYNNTGGTFTTDNTYVVAGDKGGKLVMDSDPGTRQEEPEEDFDPDYNGDDEML